MDRLARGRLANWRPGLAGRWVAAAAAALVIAQLAVLVNGFRPAQAIPASADRAVGARLAAGIRALGGTVAVPSDPGLDLLAGLPAVAHQGATDDVLRASNPALIASFTAQRRPRRGDAAVQRDRDRERGTTGRLPARPGALLPPLPADAAARRAASGVPAGRRSARTTGLPVASGRRVVRGGGRARSTARRPRA